MRARIDVPSPSRATEIRSALGAPGRLAVLAVVLLVLGPASAPGVQGRESAGQQADSTSSARSGPIEPHPEAQKAISRLKSPFCPGLMLEVCPSPQAAELRDTLRVMAERGAGADSLVAWTLARYGEEWRAIPETSGTDLLAWIVPPLAILLGGGLVVVALRRLRGGGGGEVDDEAVRSLTPEDEQRLSEALSEMEREGR